MGKPEFNYRRKPAFISFLLVYLSCFGVAYLLIDNSPLISKEINRLMISRLHIPYSNTLWNLPYGIFLSIPFLIYSIYKILWNIMSSYEINSSEIRMITGSLTRKERFYPIIEFYEISFRQNLIEIPFSVGSLILRRIRGGNDLIIKGVYNARNVAEVLRSGMGVSL
ncbi:MAG: hypothetical protein V3R54_07330 [Thermodesulfovibrionia bacterium]